MAKRKSPILSKRTIMTSTVINVAVSFVVIISLIIASLAYMTKQTVNAELLSKGQEYAGILDKKLSDAMNYLTLTASSLEAQVNNGNTDREQLQKTLFSNFDDYELIDGTSIMFERNMYDGRDDEYIGSSYGTTLSGRICWYYYYDDGKAVYMPEALENDIEFDEPYYVNAKAAGKPIYSGPFVYGVDGVDIPMLTLTYPMYNKDGTFLGAVTVDVFLLELYERLQSEKIYETGYMVITSDKDNVVYSPVYDDVGMSRKDAGVDYAVPHTGETVAYANAVSHVNGKSIYAATVPVYIPQLDNTFYVTAAAPNSEIYANGIIIMTALALFCLSTLLIILFFLYRNIVGPIMTITKSAYKMAEGNLSESDAFYITDKIHNSRNELYLLYLELKRTVAQLSEIQQIKLEAIEMRLEKERAEESSRTKSDFLAKMSHEIRTPMNAITGMAELILREDIQPAVYEHALAIKLAGANLLAIINDILDFSKIESGKLEIVPVEYQFASLVNDVISIIRMRVVDKPILFTVNTDCNLPSMLIGDEIRIRQILLNLLSNAYKYCNEGFIMMTIDGELTGDDTVLLTIEIADSGIGIKDEDIEKLFGDFVQIDMVKNKGVEGTGLGLAITRSLCRAMDGDISAQSVYGEGSVFTVTLPQKFSKYEKFASVENPEEKNVLIYETRPVYSSSIVCSIDNLDVSCTLVTNQSSFCQELEKHTYPYVFVSSFLLDSAKRMLSRLDIKTNLVLLYEFGEAVTAVNTRMLSMPAHSISIANILNDVADSVSYNENMEASARFIAPTARVLLVDDISTNLKVAEGLLMPYKMHVDMCKSGIESIELVKENRYDIVFMDQMMPEMDGIEATTAIRALDGENYKNLPIVALTANAISGVKEMFLKNGFNDFLAKPIETIKLNEILERWLPKEKQEKSAGIKQTSDLPPFEIEGVNVQKGVSMTGGRLDNYLKALEAFCRDGAQKIDEMSASLENTDLNSYTICVHALKSAAAYIGAADLSERAKELEHAGKNEDISFIKKNNPAIIEDLKTMIADINNAISASKNQNRPDAPDDMEYFKTEVSALVEALDNMELDRVEDILNNLFDKNWGDNTNEVLKNISQNILMCEYDDALVLIDTLLNAPVLPDEVTGFTAKLRIVQGLSVDKALSAHGGSVDAYERSVKITVDMLPENIERLNELIKTDLSLYAIEVHGIKGVLNNIGAFEHGEKALELETLSGDGKSSECKSLHPDFIQALTSFYNEMAALLGETDDADKLAGDKAALFEALPQLEEAADSLDHLSALEILSEIEKFSYGTELDSVLAELTRAFERFDFDKSEDIIKSIKGQVNLDE